MCAHWTKRWWLVISLLLAACQAGPLPASSDVTGSSAPVLVMPESVHSSSGARLTAMISSLCAGALQIGASGSSAVCQHPYAGEFVVTELNGAEVARVITDQDGQATVVLPPGRYLLGVRTEEIYPWAAPVTINVLAERYVNVELSLESGLQQQTQSQ